MQSLFARPILRQIKQKANHRGSIKHKRNQAMPNGTPDQIKQWKKNERDTRARKERGMIRTGTIKKEKGYVLDRTKDPTPHPGKWHCLCRYGIKGHDIQIRIPNHFCPAHTKECR